MNSILGNGVSGLLAFQNALNTTSHNIANVNTPGFTRQRADLQSRPPDWTGNGFTGNGAHALSPERMADRFAIEQVRRTGSDLAQQQTHSDLASRVDSLLSADGLSLTPAMNSFFESLNDASTNPDSPAAREALLAGSLELTSRFQSLQSQFDALQGEVNSRVTDNISTINETATAIAELNTLIVTAKGKSTQGAEPGDLLDQRDNLINRLAELIDVTTLEQDNGAVNVFIGNGQPIVMANQSQQLRVRPASDNARQISIDIGREGSWKEISLAGLGGSLGGTREFERDTLQPAMNELGRLAVSFATAMNEQHARGVDLNGATGGEWFSVPEPLVVANATNTGSGALSVTIDDAAALKASDYELYYDGAGYTLTRLADGVQSTGTPPLAIDGLTINLTGSPAAGDRFELSATRRAAAHVDAQLTRPGDIALGNPLQTRASLDNLSEATIGNAQVLDANDASLTAKVELRFTSDTTFDVVDVASNTPLSTGETFTANGPISYNGWQVSVGGSPRNGDVFTIAANADARADNSNGLALAGIQNAAIMDGGATLVETYGGMVTRVGGQTRTLQARSDTLQSMKDDAVNRQQAISGVNLDEEAVNLTKYEQAYQASARVIATADELFNTLLNAVAR